MHKLWQDGQSRVLLPFRPQPLIYALYVDRTRLDEIKTTKAALEKAKYDLDVAQREGNYELASRLRFSSIPELEGKLPQESSDDQGTSLLHDRVRSDDIARVVAR